MQRERALHARGRSLLVPDRCAPEQGHGRGGHQPPGERSGAAHAHSRSGRSRRGLPSPVRMRPTSRGGPPRRWHRNRPGARPCAPGSRRSPPRAAGAPGLLGGELARVETIQREVRRALGAPRSAGRENREGSWMASFRAPEKATRPGSVLCVRPAPGSARAGCPPCAWTPRAPRRPPRATCHRGTRTPRRRPGARRRSRATGAAAPDHRGGRARSGSRPPPWAPRGPRGARRGASGRG